MGKFSSLCCLILLFVLALSVATRARAQQGQYHVNYVTFDLSSLSSAGGLATYSPLKEVSQDAITLRSSDGTTYSFALDSKTVFCKGTVRVSDWTYLKKLRKKNSITVLTNDDSGTTNGATATALVVWDRPPTISLSKGLVIFALPKMCK